MNDNYCEDCAGRDSEISSLEREKEELLSVIDELKSILDTIEDQALDIATTARQGARF